MTFGIFSLQCSAMMFIENLNAESLKLSQEEFDMYVGRTWVEYLMGVS